MAELRRITVAACVLLVVLRMSIGWQFLYEGLWKIDAQGSANPWTAAGYLKNARGPFRDLFRNMAGDPNELDWLDYDKVAAEWDAWHDRFLAHHTDLSETQKKRLAQMLHGQQEFTSPLKVLPAGVKFGPTLGKAIKYDPKRKLLVVDGNRHFTPRERELLLRMVPVEKNPSQENRRQNDIARRFHRAVKRIYDLQSRLSYKERLAASLKGDPERVGLILEEHQGTIDYKRMGEIEKYKKWLDRYEKNLAKAETAFEHAHLKHTWGEIQQLRVKLVGPVKALDRDLKNEARKLLTEQQLARGPVPEPGTRISWINNLTIWALVGLGALLIAGLFTRVAAVAGAGLLLSFYLAMPPWPGVIDFQGLPGPDHSFIVNKNLIEVFALLAIATMPTGIWFGVDGLCAGLCCCRKRKSTTAATSTGKKPPAEQTEEKAASTVG